MKKRNLKSTTQHLNQSCFVWSCNRTNQRHSKSYAFCMRLIHSKHTNCLMNGSPAAGFGQN